MKYQIVREFTSYLIKLNLKQINRIFGVDTDFRTIKNESLFKELLEFDGVIDVWFDFNQFDVGNIGITIRISYDKESEELWEQIFERVNAHLA